MHSRPSAHGPAGATDSPHPEPVTLGSDLALSMYILISEPFSLGSQEHGKSPRPRTGSPPPTSLSPLLITRP